MAVEKQRHGLGDYSLGPLDQITPPIEIAPQGGSRLRPHRNDPLLTSRAFHSDKTLANLDVLYIQSRQLAQSDARRIKEFEDCQITGAREILLAGRRQEPINLVYGQIGWKPLWHLRSRHELRRIRSNDTLPAQVPEERSQGRKFPRDAASGDPPSMQVRHKGPDRHLAHVVFGPEFGALLVDALEHRDQLGVASVRRGPVAFEQLSRHGVAASRQVTQELVVQAG